jgi:tetratricopeptide (TPR) repeat protein
MSESVLWNEMGNLHMRLAAFEDAISSYGKAIELSPNFSQAYSNLGLAYYSKGKYEDAISLYRKSLDLSETSKEQSIAWKRLGDAYQKQGNYEGALAAYKKGDELDLDPESNLDKANLELDEETESDEISSAPRIESEYADIPDQPPTELPEELIEQVKYENATLSVSENIEAASTNAGSQDNKKTVTPPFLPDSLDDEIMPIETWPVKPGNPEVGLEKISQNLLSDEGEFHELNNWLQSLEANPTRVNTDFRNRGLDSIPAGLSAGIHTIINEPPNLSGKPIILHEAMTSISKSQFNTPSDAWISPKVSEQSSQRQNTASMKETSTQTVLELEPITRIELFKSWKLSDEHEQESNIWKNMIEVLERNQTSQIPPLEQVEQPVSFVVDDAPLNELFSEKRKICRELADGIENYRKITEVAQFNDKAWDTLGKLLKDAGEYQEAVAAFEKAISICPNKDLYYYHLGLVYAAQKRHEDAINSFQKVIELNPGYILAHCALAGSFRRLGREMEAEDHIKVALPRLQSETEYNRACFEAICGNTDQAIELLKLALEKKQTSPDWVCGDPDLDFIRDDPRFKELVGSSIQ